MLNSSPAEVEAPAPGPDARISVCSSSIADLNSFSVNVPVASFIFSPLRSFVTVEQGCHENKESVS